MGINNGGMDDANLKQQENISASMNDAAANAKLFANATDTAGKAGVRFGAGLTAAANQAEDYADTMEKIVKSIHNLPGVIEELTKTANKNMAYAAQDLREGFVKGLLNEKLWSVRAELANETEDLRRAVETAEKAVKMAEQSNDEYEKHTAQLRLDQLKTAYDERKKMKVSQQLNKKLAYDMKSELIKIGKQMFSDLWNYAKKILDDAYNKDRSTIESNYGTIMAYNSYNQGEYAKLIDRLQEKIDASGLGDVVSINTLQENLTKTMQAGLQGALAESNAYYASIAEKAGITFDWYGTEWTQLISQMSAQGKDYTKLMQSMITVTDDLAEYYGDSTGLAQGKAQQMNAYASSIGTTYGLDADAVSNIYKSYAITSQELSKYGIDASNIMQDITKVLESGINNEEALLAFATNGMTADQVEAQIKAGDFGTLITNYMQNAEAMYKGQNGEMIKALNSSLGGSFNETNYQALQTYWEQEGSFTENFNAAFGSTGSAINDIEGELKNYVTKQESYETKMENNLANIAEFYTQNPILEVISKTLQGGLATIIGIIAAWGGNQLLNKFLSHSGGGTGGTGGLFNLGSALKNSFGGSGGVLKNAGAAKDLLKSGASFKEVASVGGTGSAVLGKAGQLFTNGTAFASKGGSLAKFGSTAFSTGGKALGVAGSLISMGIDGYKGYQEDGWTGAARGAITGSGKAAESGWDVAKGAGSAALKGAGIGMVFGPWGAAIGAAVGGLAGLAVGLADLNNEEKQFQLRVEKATKHFESLTESIKKLDTANSTYEQNLNNNTALTNYANTLKVGQKPTQALLDAFPEYTAYLDENGNATQDYIDILKDGLEIQKQLNAIELDKLIQEQSKDVYGTSKNYKTLIENTEKAKADLDKTKADKALQTQFNKDLLSDKEIIYDHNTASLKIGNNEYTTQDLYTMFGTSASWSSILTAKDIKDKVDGRFITRYTDGSQTEAGDTEVAFTSAFGKSFQGYLNTNTMADYNSHVDLGAATTNYNNALKQQGTGYANLKATASSWNTSWKNQKLSEVLTGSVDFSDWAATHGWDISSDSNTQGSFANVLWNYNYALREMISKGTSKDTLASTYLKPSEIISAYEGYLGSSLGWTPAFSVGTTGDSTIPYDNYLAMLHKGEQVRTAAEVSLDRAAQHIASADVLSKVNDTLLTQTNAIINILSNIYTVLTSDKGTNAPNITRMVYDLPGI